MCFWLKLQQEQLDAILTTAVETSALGLITGCIKQWTTEGEHEQALAFILILVCFYLFYYNLLVCLFLSVFNKVQLISGLSVVSELKRLCRHNTPLFTLQSGPDLQ